MNRRRIGGSWVLLGVIGFVASCTQYRDPCFTPASVVGDLRVLAITADPPQPVANLVTGNVEPVRLQMLFGRASGSTGTVDVSWAVCVPGALPDCAEAAIVARDQEWQRGSSVEIRVPPELIAAAVAADPLRGAGGIRVLATVRVAGAVPEAASTPILFARPGEPRNAAPALLGVRVAREGFAAADVSLGIKMFFNSPYGLRPVLAPGAIEEFDTTDFSGRPVHLRERIRYSFYATPDLAIGRLGHTNNGLVITYENGNDSEADEPPDGTPETPAGLIPLTALGNHSGTLWIVARDSRGATSFLEVPVAVTELDPRCCVVNCTDAVFPPFFDCVREVAGCL